MVDQPDKGNMLMRRTWMAACAAILATAMAGHTMADAPPPPPPGAPAPAAPETAGPGGTMTSVNITSLKAIFSSAGISVTEGVYLDNWPYLLADLDGYKIRTSVIECANNDAQGTCDGIAVESTMTADPVTLDALNAFNQYQIYSRAAAGTADNGHAALRASFKVAPGVGPGSIESSYKRFTLEMSYFFDMMAKTAPGAQKGGFAVEPEARLEADTFSATPGAHADKVLGAP